MHLSPSLQFTLVSTHAPEVALHANDEHCVLAEQVTLGVYLHAPFSHVSAVHLLLSLHSAAICVAFLSRIPHPVTGWQKDSWQILVATGHTRGVYLHDPLPVGSHVSTVHALLSSQIALISVAVLSTSPQPL